MGATGNIIRLKPGYTSIDGLMMENAEEGLFTRRDLQIAVAKARNVLDIMEEEMARAEIREEGDELKRITVSVKLYKVFYV